MKYILVFILGFVTISIAYSQGSTNENKKLIQKGQQELTQENKNLKVINEGFKDIGFDSLYKYAKSGCKVKPKNLQELCRFSTVYPFIRRVDFCKKNIEMEKYKKCMSKQEFYFNKIISDISHISVKKFRFCSNKYIVFPSKEKTLAAYRLVQSNIMDSEVKSSLSDYYDSEKVYACLYKNNN